MKICFVVPQGRVSGAERVLIELVQARPDVELLALCPTGSELDGLLQAEGVPTRHLEVPKLAETSGLQSFATALASAGKDVLKGTFGWKPDILHVFLPLAMKAALPAALLGRRPTILSVHDVLTPSAIGPLKACLNRAEARFATSIVAVSDFVRHSLIEAGYHPERVVTVHNGINVSRFASPNIPRQELRCSLNLHDGFVFGMFGRLTPWKGQAVALEALQRLVSGGVDAQLLVLGSAFYPSDEPYAASLPQLATRLGIPDRVRFVAAQRDVASYYATVDAVLVPSSAPDPFPTVVLEAGAAGRPVVATTLGGAKEAIRDGETGIVTVPKAESFARAMHDLATSAIAIKMGNLARDHVSKEFSSARYAANMAEVWVAAKANARCEA